jgi:hypothetical protein
MYPRQRSNSYRIRSGVTLAIAPASARSSKKHALQKANRARYQLRHIIAFNSYIHKSELGSHAGTDVASPSASRQSNIVRISTHAILYPYFSEAIKPRENRGVTSIYFLRASEFLFVARRGKREIDVAQFAQIECEYRAHSE